MLLLAHFTFLSAEETRDACNALVAVLFFPIFLRVTTLQLVSEQTVTCLCCIGCEHQLLPDSLATWKHLDLHLATKECMQHYLALAAIAG